ncbi:hypothetical protein I79_001252 [Cricetulus griseus]|uniref:Uncharacterized protein n=1 Tax=Cricetulus griseus TaxID=10029 RepID=G3GU98_CRIGR|nr:hypothetical protein I79_001252 [Cricetulus griseus]
MSKTQTSASVSREVPEIQVHLLRQMSIFNLVIETQAWLVIKGKHAQNQNSAMYSFLTLLILL